MARVALVVGTQAYDDASFTPLWTPHNDVASMSSVLADQQVGDYSVQTMLDPTSRELSEQLEGFCADASSGDVRLLYLSCHGRRDSQGRLFFICRDTLSNRLHSTGVDAGFLARQMADSSCRRFLVFLDCCYSGSYSLDGKGASAADVSQLDGEGRAILAATGELSEAYQEERGEWSLSIFTRALVEGLESGDADTNGDGVVDFDELYSYVEERVRLVRPEQRPHRISKVKGILTVASVSSRAQPPDLDALTLAASDDPLKRLRAAAALRRYLVTPPGPPTGASGVPDDSLARKAFRRLVDMTNDQDEDVRSLVEGLVAGYRDAASAPPAPAAAPTSDLPAAEDRVTLESSRDPLWFKRAVFYDVLISSFKDSNGDGIGDLRGLTGRLDYLAWLGVDCLSIGNMLSHDGRGAVPGVVDLLRVDPAYGDLTDAVHLVDEAHQRGIRVITALAMNHTSDQHPWFQASRTDPEGPFGDFYVWSDSDERYSNVRVLLSDTETSNWAWDPVRRQYYWHRFSSNRPDLNYDNPGVQDAVLDALKFWLDLGIDGVRLDGAPYLFEDERSGGDSHPLTHQYLKRLRKIVEASYPDRVLLAVADQPPADLVAYFGDGDRADEVHMAFHFPVMSRLFMAVRRESRYPISEILAGMPPIPGACQWGIFLRNQDELSLEMLTDDERDYMYGEYARDPHMKSNVGIARRLAPLLDNDREQIELLTGLLLSLPGSPVLYYGDEIGMGDNIYLGDRDAVRTPMQWNPDRNAGFSTADPQRLGLPVVIHPVYGHQAVNVEAQMGAQRSLLQWTRKLLSVRRQHPVFGMGGYEELGASNPSVLAFVRQFGDERVLCVNNLSRFPQPVELDLRRFKGSQPVELTGLVQFPLITDLPYLITLSSYGFHWFHLSR